MFDSLHPHIQYRLAVINLDHPKKFTSLNGDRYSHKIFFRDKWGKEYKGDYVTSQSTQNDFPLGEFVSFRVVQMEAGKTPLIEPNTEQDQSDNVEKRLIMSNMPPVQGKSYSQALAVSAQLLVAEKQGVMAEVSNHDIDRLLSFADQIDSWMIQKEEQRVSDEPRF